MEVFNVVFGICVFLIALIISAVGREIMAGLMALRYGDFTPKASGRITLNPLRHIDILGTLILPLSLLLLGVPFVYGYAKPMPINFSNIQKESGVKGCFLVSLAGSFFNFFLTFLCIVVLKIVLGYEIISQNSLISQSLFILFSTNIILAVFNLIPIPPLDGAKILAFLGLLFNVSIFAMWYNKLEKYGMILIILVVLLPPTQDFIVQVINIISILFLRI